MSENSVRIDFTGLNLKIAAVKKAAEEAAKAAVDYGLSEVSREVARNLSGIRHKPGTPSPTPGQLPVSIIMSQIRRSTKIKRLSPVVGIIYSDKSVAPYAYYVHYGTKKMKARRYMTAAVQAKRELIIKQFKSIIKDRVQREGRA